MTELKNLYKQFENTVECNKFIQPILKKLPHSKAILSSLEIWAERRKKYGDGWKDNKEYMLLAMIMEKARRLEAQFENPTENAYESKEDSLIDLINWAMFYLQNLKDGKYNKDRNN